MPYIYQCPYCKADRHIKSDTLVSYGCPLKECSRCKRIYIDPYCKESALESYHPHSTSKLFLSNLFSGIGLDVIVAVIVLLISGSETVAGITLAIGFPICWFLMFLYTLLNRKKVEQNHRKIWNESDKRLKNPQYATLLANLDYKVPAYYLPADFKYSSEKESYKPAKVSGFRIG